MKYKLRVILFLILLLAGFTVHYLQYGRILPDNLHMIVELIRNS
jgi:hypothetical protein